jgi:hypothetical protein
MPSVVRQGSPILGTHEGSRNCCIGESRWYFETRIVVLVVFLQVPAALDIQSSELSATIPYVLVCTICAKDCIG